MTSSIFPKEVNDILSKFIISQERLVQINNDIQLEFTAGLNSVDKKNSSIAMLPSYVPALPDGTGLFFALKFLVF